MRRRIRVVVIAAALLALCAGGAGARPAGCGAVVDDATAAVAAAELRRYAGDLQAGLTDVTYGHVNRLLTLAEALDDAPRVGCGTVLR